MRNAPVGEYTDRLIHDLDRRAVFERTWQMLGPASQVAQPGQYVAEELCGTKVFAQRGADGVVRAFRNVCRHRGARLLPEGTGSCATIRCPYHHWAYDHSGALISTPVFGEPGDIDHADWPLEQIAVEEWRGLLFVAVAPGAPLAEQLGGLPAFLADEPIESYRMVAEERLEFDANWKIYTDNFVEGYHIPGIHPAFFRSIEFAKFETTARDGYVHMTAPPRGDLFYRGTWLWMWPNWTLSLFAGGMNTSRINPLSIDRTELIYHFWFADRLDDDPEVVRAEQRHTIDANLAVVREDFEICLHTQRNYASGAYSPGPLSPAHEQGVAWFQRRLVEAREPVSDA